LTPTNGLEAPAKTAQRLKTIAEEARLIGACPTELPTSDIETKQDFIDKHSFGCGPYHGQQTAAPIIDTDKKWVSTACPMSDSRPSYEPIVKPPTGPLSRFGGTHSPITYAEVQYDACYIADQTVPAMKVSISQLIHLIDQLQYEFDQIGCTYGSRPSQETTDYALDRKFGCGTYPPLP